MNIKEQAIQGIVWSAIQNWGSQAGSLLVFLVLARLLQPAAFGLVALANVFLALMQTFLNQGFAQAIIQRKDLEPEHLDTAFWTNLAIGVTLTLVGLLTADAVADLFREPALAGILRGLSALFVITAFGNIQQAILERHLAFKAIALRWLIGTLVGGLIGVGMAFYGAGVWSLVGQQIGQELVGSLVLWQSSRWRPGLKVSRRHFQHLFGFGINILGFNLLHFLNSRADDFLIGYFLGPVALGYYSVAYRVLGVMQQLLVNTSRQVALPTFSRLQQDLEGFRRAFYTATQFTSLIAFPVFLGVVTLAPEFVRLVFGEQWIPSIPVLQVLAFAGIFQAISFFKSSVFIALGKPSWALWLAALSTVLNLIGFAIAVRWGIVAVAAAFVLRGYLVFPIGQWAVSRLIQIPLRRYLQQFAAPLTSSVIMTFAILIAKELLGDWGTLPGRFMVCVAIGTLVYGLAIWLLSPKLFQKLLQFVDFAKRGI